MKAPLLFSLLLPLFISACTTAEPPESQPQPEQNSEPTKTVFTLPKAEAEFRGELILYQGSGRFKNCNGESLYWLNASPKITTIYNSLVKAQGEAVYIEFMGNITKAPDEVADQFDGEVKPQKLHHMANLRNTLGCMRTKPTEVMAFGLNNEWQATLSADRITLESPEAKWNKPVNKAYVELGNNKVWEGTDSSGFPVIFKVFAQDCRTSNNDYWSYSSYYIATVEKQGCAEDNTVDTRYDFSGHYNGTLPIDGKEVEFDLTLKPDYSLEASFTYSSDNAPIVHSGFWQPIDNNTLAVSLVRKTDPHFLNQFLFKWDGKKLSTTQQGLGGLTEPLAGKGATLWQMESGYTQVGSTTSSQRTFTPQNLPFERKEDAAVKAALLNYFKIHRTKPNGMQYNFNRFDLNGDGQPELLVQLNWCSSNGCTLLIFENRGEQGYRFVSRTTDIHHSLLLATGTDYQWQQLLARRGKEYVLLSFDGIGYPVSSKGQPVAASPLPLTGVELFAEPEPTVWYHTLPR